MESPLRKPARASSGGFGQRRPPPPPPGPIARATPAALGILAARPAAGLPAMPRFGFGLPNLRRNVCPHYYMTGVRGAIPIQAPHLLKALMRQETNVSRCQLRGGVHLEHSYVADICLSARFNQCVFYEDDLSHD
ncbi:MAG: hypothetical protein XU10_C0015G0031 [Chloroflexi bacterium CSP1-4]|nr:MAG: hypothetical protein XU10_C0015G0031 [Chloroflexi bacterium CSP1-4]